MNLEDQLGEWGKVEEMVDDLEDLGKDLFVIVVSVFKDHDLSSCQVGLGLGLGRGGTRTEEMEMMQEGDRDGSGGEGGGGREGKTKFGRVGDED